MKRDRQGVTSVRVKILCPHFDTFSCLVDDLISESLLPYWKIMNILQVVERIK